jgi:hypothetical protein
MGLSWKSTFEVQPFDGEQPGIKAEFDSVQASYKYAREMLAGGATHVEIAAVKRCEYDVVRAT